MWSVLQKASRVWGSRGSARVWLVPQKASRVWGGTRGAEPPAGLGLAERAGGFGGFAGGGAPRGWGQASAGGTTEIIVISAGSVPSLA
jgi:hypothetical protein